ncbi:MAG TPA: ATP-binding cassette domain-containing protein [Chthoniobacteraceae bacterium]|nr:ATP-binding cassette domain-containing protein [Chthoniobacteraceae bacterium]
MIKVRNLKKNFGSKIAVNGVSFSVEKGEVLGFLGPNGAGKSTTMRMITGFIPPSDGEVSVGGFNVMENPTEAKRIMGYLPENAPLYSDMTVNGFLGFCAELRGLRGDAKRKAVSRAVEMCFLESVMHQSIDTLSKGYKHRTCLAQSILHDPEVLIMDEPTDGLDPNQKHEVRTLIRNMGEKKAIIFSTHLLEEVEAVCSRAIIIDRGQVVANGTPDELKRRSKKAGSVTLRLGQSASLTASAVAAKLNALSGVEKCVINGESPIVVYATPRKNDADGELARSIYETAGRESWKIEELHTEEGQLDDVFRSITLGDKAGKKEAKESKK